MATISRTICDVHLTRGEEVDATSRSIEMDGNRFRVDLCDSCYQEHIQPFVSFRRAVAGPGAGREGAAEEDGCKEVCGEAQPRCAGPECGRDPEVGAGAGHRGQRERPGAA
jgi:hypothetical protein